MGNCVGGFKRRTRIIPWKRNKRIVLCILGIDGAGKTTVVKALQGEDLSSVHPTVGFSRAEFELRKHKVVAYDLGGGERIRDIWKTYFAEVYGLVYVVDSSALSRIEENRQMVQTLVEHKDLVGKPILFLLNKKDLPEAMDEMQFSEQFELHNMAKRNKTDIRVEGICAVKGFGKDMDPMIADGIEWLIERIVDRYATIEKGVEAALRALKERQEQERSERQHRLAALAAARAAEQEESASASGDQATAAEGQADIQVPVPKPANGNVAHGSPKHTSVSVEINHEEMPGTSHENPAFEPDEDLPVQRRRSLVPRNKIVPEADLHGVGNDPRKKVDFAVFQARPTTSGGELQLPSSKTRAFSNVPPFTKAEKPKPLDTDDSSTPEPIEMQVINGDRELSRRHELKSADAKDPADEELDKWKDTQSI
ncbi:ADP-ribosylation factor family protein [Aphelenchoides avenae]|nr:ADP-ribosylation factor family protein [Aphelenchus avenae]